VLIYRDCWIKGLPPGGIHRDSDGGTSPVTSDVLLFRLNMMISVVDNLR
jgi:hypothetical protein